MRNGHMYGHVVVPKAFHRELKVAAVTYDVSMAALVIEGVMLALEKRAAQAQSTSEAA